MHTQRMKNKKKFKKHKTKKKFETHLYEGPLQQRRQSDVEQQTTEWVIQLAYRCGARGSQRTQPIVKAVAEKRTVGSPVVGRAAFARVESAAVGPRHLSAAHHHCRRCWWECGGGRVARAHWASPRPAFDFAVIVIIAVAVATATSNTTTTPPVLPSRGDRRHLTRATFARTRRLYNKQCMASAPRLPPKTNQTHWRRVGTFENDFIRFSRPHPTRTPTKPKPTAATA